MEKIKVLFPFVEAGFGHIMAEKSIADAFEKKYGDHCEVMRCDFFKEYGEPLAKFEKRMCDEVKKYNVCNLYGYLNIAAMNLFDKTANDFVMKRVVKGAYEDGLKRMAEIAPDAVVSTHWATNYYAEKIQNKPVTVMYGPDAHLNAFFRYPCDLALISIPSGYRRALRFKRRFDVDNLKLVPTAIRQEAFDIDRDKTALRKKLGLKDKFTVVIMDGGYGVGLTRKLTPALLKEDLPINVVVVCGKNPELYDEMKQLKSKGNTDYYPFGFCENILEYIAASDLYLGKSGSGLLEPAFFHVPIIVTHSANTIEKLIADHYVNEVGDAKRISTIGGCVRFIKNALGGSDEYAKMLESVDKLQSFGGEGIADEIFAKLDEEFKLTKKD